MITSTLTPTPIPAPVPELPPWAAAAALCLAGGLTKAADQVEDEGLWTPRVGPVLGALFGALMGASTWAGRDFASLSAAVALAVLLAGKVDAPAHRVALAALVSLALASPHRPDLPLLAALSAAAYLDEPLSDAADEGRLGAGPSRILRLRPILKLVILLSLASGWISTWAAVGGWGYDACYWAAEKLTSRRPSRGADPPIPPAVDGRRPPS